MRQIRPKQGQVKLFHSDGPIETVDALIVGSLAVVECEDGTSWVVHVATGRRLATPIGTVAMAQHLNRECRWTWSNELEFGIKPEGRGGTMITKSLRAAYESFTP